MSNFSKTLKETMDILNLSAEDLADELRVSRPTIPRWLEGKGPHPGMQPAIMEFLNEKLRKELRKLKQERAQAKLNELAEKCGPISTGMLCIGSEEEDDNLE